MKTSKFVIITSSLLIAGCLLFNCYAFSSSVEIKTTKDNGYYLEVDGKPFIMKGVIYNPVPIGKGYDYDFFTDKNKPWLVDGKLMKEMGINCVRLYSAGKDLDAVKSFISDMYEKFGIYTIMSDWLGLWSYPSANYANKDAQEKTKKRVLGVVNALKNEKGLLIWILGNENNYTFSGKIGFWTSPEIEEMSNPQEKTLKKAEIYYKFINDIAKEIKKIDKSHPVALGNGEASFLNIAGKNAPDVDALAIILYRGKKFGNFFKHVQKFFDRPIFLSEFGCDSYNSYTKEEDQQSQSQFLLSQWEDLYKNTVFSGNQSGNCLGGIIFEWSDEWWKHNEGYTADWSVHNSEAGWSDGSYYFDIKAENGFNMSEEWFGIVALGETEDGINKRIPKKAFYTIKEWLSQINQSL
ncbi:MAG: hypothetical protein GY858_07680 [Candidatus Omnitrophica bacterium]|nr:hypothetical protein [Candidatus Omnitrophota bacterium]